MFKKREVFKKGIAFLVAVVMVLPAGCDTPAGSSRNGDTAYDDTRVPSEPVKCRETFPCSNVTLVSNLRPEELMGERLNDIWGWTDPETGTEYALVGLTDRVTFVDISEPAAPLVVGTLPEALHSGQGNGNGFLMPMHDEEDEGKSAWRDVKVYDNHAFVVSDGQPHGLQVFDLRRLRQVENPPAIFSEDLHYTDFGNAHNIAVNVASGYAYVAGSNRFGGGLYILDISTPLNPQLAGYHTDVSVGRSEPGYVHDTQCVMYGGPDVDYDDREICFNASETHLVIADVTEKQATATITKVSYPGNSYAHQGWLTEDHRYFLLDDELDESGGGVHTGTYIFDLIDLDDPKLVGRHAHNTLSIDHNQYVKGNYTYQANYTAGLRILDLSEIGEGVLEEVAYFDTYPADNATKFDGAWSVYPYFESGVIVVSDISNGLFVLRANLEQ